MSGDGALAGIFTYVGWSFLPNVRTWSLVPYSVTGQCTDCYLL